MTLLLALAAAAVVPLLAGSQTTEASLPGGVPLGNALAAIGLGAIAAAAVVLSARRSVLRKFSWMALFVAMAWLPVSIALAGNLALNFSGDRGLAWMLLTAATVSCVLLALLAAAIGVAIAWWRARGSRV